MLPAIRENARHRFLHYPCEEREELVAEAIGLAFAMFVRLVERGMVELAYVTPLSEFATRQVAFGRRLGTPLNKRDVTSAYCQHRTGVFVQRLDRYDKRQAEWQQMAVEDKQTTPAELAAFRIDFPDWLSRHTERNRRIALDLAVGNSTTEVARQHGLSLGRISQLRRQFAESWQQFHAGTVAADNEVDAVTSA